MKNTLKKFAYALAAAALITVGAASVHASNFIHIEKNDTAHDVWEKLNASPQGNR